MCGIVGLFCKSAELEPHLGAHIGAMLAQMDDRGPDSAGVAVYRNPAPSGACKVTLYSAGQATSWESVVGVVKQPPPVARLSVWLYAW